MKKYPAGSLSIGYFFPSLILFYKITVIVNPLPFLFSAVILGFSAFHFHDLCVCIDDRQWCLELVARVCDKAFLFLDTLFYRSEYHPGKDHYQQKDVFCSVFCLRHSVAVDSLESCGFVFLLSWSGVYSSAVSSSTAAILSRSQSVTSPFSSTVTVK